MYGLKGSFKIPAIEVRHDQVIFPFWAPCFFLFFVRIVSRQMSFRALTGETLSTPGYDSVVTT